MLPILFEIGRFKFYSFGTFIALGTIIGGILIFRATKYRKLKTHHLFDTILYTLLFSLIGARLTYYFIYSNQFQNFWQVLYFWQGGLVALGGIVVGFLTYLYFIRKEKDSVWQSLDIAALGLLAAWAVGKFGCFLSTCSIGRPTDSFLAVNGVFPIDIFSAVWAIIVGVLLFRTWLTRRLSNGVVFFLALEGLFLGELLIKTLRADFAGSNGRVEALVYLALIVLVYILFWKMHGPRIERNNVGLVIKNFIFRRRRN